MPATTSKRRDQSRSPEPGHRAKRQKQTTTNASSSNVLRPLPSAADLCLDHLLHDGVDHPLCERNLDQVVDSISPPETLLAQLRDPLAWLMQHVDVKEVDSSEKLDAVRRRLLGKWMERVARIVGLSMCEFLNVTSGGSRPQVLVELDEAKVELKLVPLVPVTESDVDEGDQEESSASEAEGPAEEHERDEAGDEHVEEEGPERAVKEEVQSRGRVSASVQGSGYGEEPPSPDNSGDENALSDVEVGHIVRAEGSFEGNTAYLTRPERTTVHYYPRVLTPAKYLSVTDTVFYRTQKPPVSGEEIAQAFTAAIPTVHPHVERYDEKTWLADFGNAADAALALSRPVRVRHKPARMERFRPKWTQTYLCTTFPPGADVTTLARDLLVAFPTERFYLGRCPLDNNRDGAKVFVVIFDRVGDMKAFRLQMKQSRGGYLPAMFMARPNGLPCYACQRSHHLATCSKLSEAGVVGEYDHLLQRPPNVLPIYAPVE